MVENLKRGDKVATSGGIVGTVERIIDNEKVEVQIAENINVEVVRSTRIQGLVNTAEPKITLFLNVIFFKIKNFSVIIFTVILSYFTISNFIKFDDNFFSKNIKLGLDFKVVHIFFLR